jgi:predicted tellurium resistance membrane protein TerC
MDWLTDPNIWISLITLTVLEIVLGIDNIIFISILAGKLPAEQQGKARTTGLMLALVMRIILLCSIFWLTRLTADLFTLWKDGAGNFHFMLGELAKEQISQFRFGRSGKDFVMIAGGIFLLWKSVHEIHGSLEGEDHEQSSGVKATMSAVISQIVVIDIVFSLDSVITAVGMAQAKSDAARLAIMIAAVILAMAVMLVASGPISNYVNRHPTIKMLALSFLLLVGVVLIADGFGQHVSKGYIYFAMAFSFAVEMLNIRMRAKRKPVELRHTY